MMQSLSCAWFVFALGRFPAGSPRMVSVSHNRAMDSWLALAACGWQKGRRRTSVLRHREKFRVALDWCSTQATTALQGLKHARDMHSARLENGQRRSHNSARWTSRLLSSTFDVIHFRNLPPRVLLATGARLSWLLPLRLRQSTSSEGPGPKECSASHATEPWTLAGSC